MAVNTLTTGLPVQPSPQEALRGMCLEGAIPAEDLAAPQSPVYAEAGGRRYVVVACEVTTTRDLIDMTTYGSLGRTYVTGFCSSDVTLTLETDDVQELVRSHVDGLLHLDHQIGAHRLVGQVVIQHTSVLLATGGPPYRVVVRGALVRELSVVDAQPELTAEQLFQGPLRGMAL